jgi:hypothetical protein
VTVSKTKHQTVAEMWASFAKATMPELASNVQRREMRRAFYAGAYGMLMGAAFGPGEEDVSEEEGVAMFEAWRKELEAFQRDVLEGRA